MSQGYTIELTRPSTQAAPAKTGLPRWRVRSSAIHGRGAFCLNRIAKGEIIGFYEGAVISEQEATSLYGSSEHTFLFLRGDGMIIDGGQGGNGTRFINHGCAPNVESFEDGDRIELAACREILAGDELLLDYRLQADEGDEHMHPCRCGSSLCRGSMVWTERKLG